MLTGRRGSTFIRQLGGPGADSGIVCFRFWQLVPAGGCPYRCAYCFLQTTPWFRFKPDQLYGLVPMLYKEGQALWRALGLPFRGCYCLLDAGILSSRKRRRASGRFVAGFA